MSGRLMAPRSKETLSVGSEQPFLIGLPRNRDGGALIAGDNLLQKRVGDGLDAVAGYFNFRHFMSSIGVSALMVGQAGTPGKVKDRAE